MYERHPLLCTVAKSQKTNGPTNHKRKQKTQGQKTEKPTKQKARNDKEANTNNSLIIKIQ